MLEEVQVLPLAGFPNNNSDSFFLEKMRLALSPSFHCSTACVDFETQNNDLVSIISVHSANQSLSSLACFGQMLSLLGSSTDSEVISLAPRQLLFTTGSSVVSFVVSSDWPRSSLFYKSHKDFLALSAGVFCLQC